MNITKLSRLAVFKTIWINFHVLPFKQAVHLPIHLAKGVKIGTCPRGCISLPDGGSFHVGFHCYQTTFPQKSRLSIAGSLVLRGKGFHTFSHGLIIRIAKAATLEIGNNFSCHRNNTFLVNKKIVIGDENMWSFENVTMDTDAHTMFDSEGKLLNPNREVVIGDRVWVGSRNTILKGAIVPDGCVLGSGGTVSKKLDKPRSVYIGNTLLKENVIWTRTLNHEGVDLANAFMKR